MDQVRLGRTGLMVTRLSFGALPIQRVDKDNARIIFRRAFDAGINFYDTARGYTDSEEKIGYALSDVRHKIILATKSPSKTKDGVLENIETSLRNLKTDYVDVLQLHNPEYDIDFDDENSAFAGAMEAKKRGYCRFVGVTQHNLERAYNYAACGKFDTVQFPFSCLATEREIGLTQLCAKEDVGFIAMKALAGGLISNIPANFAFLRQLPNIVPIYGIQKLEELEQFIALDRDPPVWDDTMIAQIEAEKAQLSGNFCRGCAYCMPCPQGINISWDARMSLMLKRAVTENFLTPQWKEEMDKINTCIECGQCKSRCPYGLDTPTLLKENLTFYREFVSQYK